MNYSKENNPVQILVYSTGIIYEKEFLHYCKIKDFQYIEFRKIDYGFWWKDKFGSLDSTYHHWRDYQEIFNNFKKWKLQQ